MTVRSRVLIALVVVVSLAAPAVTASGAAPAVDTGTTRPSALAAPGGALQATNGTATNGTATNGTTPVTRHRNPDVVDEAGNPGSVVNYLSQTLSGRLKRSTVQLQSGDYEQARELLGEEYRSKLSRYVDIAEETDQGGTADTYEQARQNQLQFIDSLQEYRQTYDAYREARNEGDTQRARQLAREINEQADTVRQTSTPLRETYDDISNQTLTNMSAQSDTVQSVQSNVTRQEQQILSAEFVETRIVARAESTAASFSDPVTVSGRIETANGTPVADTNVTIVVGSRQIRTATDGQGRYSIRYRPTTVTIGAAQIPVQFRPVNTSKYLGSNESIALQVRQVMSDVRVTRRPATVAFGDRVTVTGQVTVDNVSVQEVPVDVEYGGVLVARTETDEQGAFAVSTTVPASVPTGNQTVEATVAMQDRALAPAVATRPVSVETTATALDGSVVAVENRTITTRGRLRTQGGAPVPGQDVTLFVDGQVLASPSTDANGNYEANVTVSRDTLAGANQSVRIVARFDGDGTNLEGASAATTASLGDAPNGTTLPDGLASVARNPGQSLARLHPGELLLTGGLAALLLGVVLNRVRRRRRSEPAAVRTTEESDESPGDAAAQSDGSETESQGEVMSVAAADPTQALDAARDQLSTGNHDAAVELAFLSASLALADRLDVDPGLTTTHRELYQACETAGLGDSEDRFRDLTERYERAAFSREVATRDQAATAVELAESLVG